MINKNSNQYDIAIIGAGSTGTTLANFLHEDGWNVVLIEKKILSQAGPSWVNGILPTAFDEAGLQRPSGEEIEQKSFPIVMAGRFSKKRLNLKDGSIWNINMPSLLKRLHKQAQKNGISIYANTKAEKFIFDNNRPVELIVSTKNNSSTNSKLNSNTNSIKANLFVDASGIKTEMGRQHPLLSPYCKAIADEHICFALQEDYKINDVDGVNKFLTKNKISAGTMLNILGTAGGYSTLTVHVSPNKTKVGLLAGSIKANELGQAPDMIKELKKQEPWIGEKIQGGSGLIPLHHPYSVITAPGLALLGNAACQVFPIHGSGVGNGLIAARILSDAIKGTKDPGSMDALWTYNVNFQRSIGSKLASYDLFRRLSQSLNENEINKMIELGLTTANQVHSGLKQEMPKSTLSEVGNIILAILKHPIFVAGLIPTLSKMPLLYFHYKHFPEIWNEKKIKKWDKGAKAINGY